MFAKFEDSLKTRAAIDFSSILTLEDSSSHIRRLHIALIGCSFFDVFCFNSLAYSSIHSSCAASVHTFGRMLTCQHVCEISLPIYLVGENQKKARKTLRFWLQYIRAASYSKS